MYPSQNPVYSFYPLKQDSLVNQKPQLNSENVQIAPLQPKTIPTKFVGVLPIEKKEEKPDKYREFKTIKHIDGPSICANINVKAFAHMLREGLTTGMSNRVYLQRGYHKFWVPIHFLSIPNDAKLYVNFMYTTTILKSWEFPVLASDGGFGAQCELDLLTDKFFLQKRLYRFEFIVEDLKVVTPDFSIVNLQQFTKTKKRKFSTTKWTFVGVHPRKGSSTGGEFVGLYFNEPFNPQDKIYFDGLEAKCLFSGFNGSSQFLNAKYMVIVETPKHDAAKDIKITVGGSSSTLLFTYE